MLKVSLASRSCQCLLDLPCLCMQRRCLGIYRKLHIQGEPSEVKRDKNMGARLPEFIPPIIFKNNSFIFTFLKLNHSKKHL